MKYFDLLRCPLTSKFYLVKALTIIGLYHLLELIIKELFFIINMRIKVTSIILLVFKINQIIRNGGIIIALYIH